MITDLSQSAPLNWQTFMQGLWNENPVFVMVLGLCPVLAVTNSAINAMAMGLATTFVLICSGVLVSLLRKVIPKQVRIACYIINDTDELDTEVESYEDFTSRKGDKL